jgi:Uma2 family endonuclease
MAMSAQGVGAPRIASLWEWLTSEGEGRYEFEDGELRERHSPSGQHQDIVGLLFALLYRHCVERGLGRVRMEIDVALPTGKGYIPDLVFVSRAREAELFTPEGKVLGVPDLVVEVISPGTRLRDTVHKLNEYHRAGVRWYWLVDSETLSVQEYEYTPDGYLLRASVEGGQPFQPRLFEGLTIDLAALLSEGDS